MRLPPPIARSLLAGLLTAVALAAPARPAPPDILLVTVDTLRADHLSSYGYERSTSPEIDALLARGVRFADARTVEPLTAPALASMLTSLHPHGHGSTRNGLRVRSNLASFSRILGRRGYRTAAFVGNWTLKEELSGLAEHFDVYEALLSRKRWFGLAKREATADDLNEAALAWLEDHLEEAPRRPYLLWVHYVEPHAPYRLRGEYLEQIGVGKGASLLSARNRYDSEIAYVDRRIGDLLAEVDRRAGLDDTLVVFVADHGESLGNHGYWGHGRHLYDATLAIPMGIVWPGRIEPRTIDAPALILDLAPTVVGLAGHEVPPHFRGFDWTAVLTGGEPPPAGRVTLYQTHRSSVGPDEPSDRLRQKGLQEVGRIAGGVKEIFRTTNDRRRLFDLEADPAEQNSRVALDSEISPELAAWLAEVEAGLAASDDLPPPTLTEEDLAALRALGYID